MIVDQGHRNSARANANRPRRRDRLLTLQDTIATNESGHPAGVGPDARSLIQGGSPPFFHLVSSRAFAHPAAAPAGAPPSPAGAQPFAIHPSSFSAHPLRGRSRGSSEIAQTNKKAPETSGFRGFGELNSVPSVRRPRREQIEAQRTGLVAAIKRADIHRQPMGRPCADDADREPRHRSHRFTRLSELYCHTHYSTCSARNPSRTAFAALMT